MTTPSPLIKDPSTVATLVGVAIGALLTTATFLASYFTVERPKIRLEEKKVAIDAYKQLIQLQPNVDFDCDPRIASPEAIEFICTAKNVGSFGASYILRSVVLHSLAANADGPASASWYSIEKSTEPSYVPAGSESNLEFRVKIDRAKMPRDAELYRLGADITISAQSDRQAFELLTRKFPEDLEALESLRVVETMLKIKMLPESEKPRNESSEKLPKA